MGLGGKGDGRGDERVGRVLNEAVNCSSSYGAGSRGGLGRSGRGSAGDGGGSCKVGALRMQQQKGRGLTNEGYEVTVCEDTGCTNEHKQGRVSGWLDEHK